MPCIGWAYVFDYKMFDSTPYSTFAFLSLLLTMAGLRSSRTGFSDERDPWRSTQLSTMERGLTNLRNRLGDPCVKQVPRLARIDERGGCISLWTEEIYCLSVDGKVMDVLNLIAWNTVLIEDRFDPGPESRTYTRQALTDKGLSWLPLQLIQTSKHRATVFTPVIPRIIDACLDQ